MKFGITFDKVKQSFKEIDFLAKPPNVFFKGKSKYFTSFGAFLTIICFFFLLIFSLYFIQDFVESTNPEILYSDDIYLKPKVYVFSTRENPILISLYNAEFEYTSHSSFFHARLAQESQTSEGINMLSYDMEACTEDHFQGITDPEVRKEYMNLNFTRFLCAPNNLTLSVRGSLIDETLSSLRIFFYECKNKTNGPVCATPEKIHRQLRSGYLCLYLLDFYVDKIKNLHTRNPYIKKIVCTFAYHNSHHINVYLKWTEVITNDHPIFNTERSDSFINFDSLQDYNIEAEEFFQYHVLLSNNKHVYRRRFKKFQDVLANVGGVMNAVLFFLTCIYKLYTNLLFKIDLINSSFAIEFLSKDFNDGDKHFDHGGNDKTKGKGDSQRKSQLHASYYFKNKNNLAIELIPDHSSSVKPIKMTELKNKKALQDGGSHPKSAGDSDQDWVELNNLELGPKKTVELNKRKPIGNSLFKLDKLDYIYYYTGLFRSEKRKNKIASLEKSLDFLAQNAGIENIIKNDYEIRRIKRLINFDHINSDQQKAPLSLRMVEVEEDCQK